MTTVIKIGDRVTWQPQKKASLFIPGRLTGCKVLALYDDMNGRAVATLDTGRPFGQHDAYVTDLQLEDKPDKTTILSGG